MDFFYLIHIQFLGYNYHGWAKQPNVKTIQGVVEKTLGYILGHEDFRTLGCSRTDAKVSANHYAFELFIKEKIDETQLVNLFNESLPADIKALGVREVSNEFNIIKSVKKKEYLYQFTFGQKPHPFTSPTLAAFSTMLDIELMQQGAKIFEGLHNFKNFTKNPSENAKFERKILVSSIEESNTQTLSFPFATFIYRIEASGFLRYQIRLMMGQLVLLGQGDATLEDIKQSLSGETEITNKYLAPPAGLILNKVEFSN